MFGVGAVEGDAGNRSVCIPYQSPGNKVVQIIRDSPEGHRFVSEGPVNHQGRKNESVLTFAYRGERASNRMQRVRAPLLETTTDFRRSHQREKQTIAEL